MEIGLAIAAVALVAAGAFAFLTRAKWRGDPNADPELVAAAKAVFDGKCECGGQVVKDLADDGDMAVFNCLNPECGKRFMIDLSEPEDG
jgi:hypothetical protein